MRRLIPRKVYEGCLMRSFLRLFQKGLLPRTVIFLVLVVLAILAGLYLGKKSVPAVSPAITREPSDAPTAALSSNSGQADDAQGEESGDHAPIFLYVGGKVQENWEVTGAQLALASSAGLNRFVVPLALDWSEAEESGAAAGGYNAVLEKYLQVNEKAGLLLSVDLNPPVHWLERHPEAAIMINESLQAYPSISSPLWIETAQRLLEQMIHEVESGPYKEHLQGYMLTALTDQRWMLTNEFDRSAANEAGFRTWLRQTYVNEDAFRSAWGSPDAAFDTAVIPARPETEDGCNALVVLPEQQPLVDFYRFCSERVADVLAGMASLTARVSAIEPMILAPYGYSFEAQSSASGHFALELLLDSEITGFVSPVSYFDRGLGGVGGMMGAIDSLNLRGKKWYIIDDTRTGVERSEETGEFGRIKGVRAEDVYEVQRRNFAMAITYGLGLIWSDPQGEGWLNDQEQWVQLGRLKDIYAKRLGDTGQGNDQENEATITVVVDESVNFYLQCAEHMNSVLLQRGRDAVLRSGASTRFHLLSDVVDGIAPPTPVYLFLNAFSLTNDERGRLHARFTQEQSCAIWVYAPGYFGSGPAVENISAVTGMKVKAFENPTQSGSRYILAGGQYLQADENIGTQELWDPLFYVEPSEEVDLLADYTGSEKRGSIAMLTLPEGWTSLYIAEPEVTPALVSALLKILEQPMYPNTLERAYYDVVFARPPFITLHASRSGKRSLGLGYFCDIEDQIDSNIGWYQKDNILLPLRTGETRLLLLRALQTNENP